MADRVLMTFEEIAECKRDLQQKRDEFSQTTERLNAAIERCAAGWEGAAQVAFLDRYQSDLLPVFRQTVPDVIDAMNAKLEGAMDAIRQTDQQIAAAFRG